MGVCYRVQSVRSKEEKEVLDHFAGVVIFFLPVANWLQIVVVMLYTKVEGLLLCICVCMSIFGTFKKSSSLYFCSSPK